MEAPRRYAYVTPWKIVIPAVAIIALCGFVPFWFGRLILSTRTEYVGITFMIVSVTFIAFCFFALGVAFFVMAALGLIVRLGFRRTLVLDDRCIIVPSGFFRLRHRRIPYVDVTQMWERRSPDGVTLWVVTEEAKSEIQSWLLTKPASYDEIKRFIYARAPEVQRLFAHHEPPAWMTWIVPKPLLKWTEPGDWQRYRTHLFDTSPLGARLGRAVWFFARWFGCFLVLWLGASLLDTPFWPSLLGFLGAAIPGVLWITYFEFWSAKRVPVRPVKISIFDDRIDFLHINGQTATWKMGEVKGWFPVDRQFEGRTIHLLLLRGVFKRGTFVTVMALPDLATRDQVTQLFTSKNILLSPDLSPPWESKN